MNVSELRAFIGTVNASPSVSWGRSPVSYAHRLESDSGLGEAHHLGLIEIAGIDFEILSGVDPALLVRVTAVGETYRPLEVNVCEKCGGLNVEHAAWEDLNLEHAGGDFGSWCCGDNSYCQDCENPVQIESRVATEAEEVEIRTKRAAWLAQDLQRSLSGPLMKAHVLEPDRRPSRIPAEAPTRVMSTRLRRLLVELDAVLSGPPLVHAVDCDMGEDCSCEGLS